MRSKTLLGFLLSIIVLSVISNPRASAMTAAEIAKKWGGSVVLVRVLDERENEIASGSGFIIGPELVATCYHTVAGGVAAQVKTAERIIYPVIGVVATDRPRDLAILRVKRLEGVLPVELGDSSMVKPGDAVVAMGNPLGLEGSISDGVVSGLRDLEKFGEVIQVSAPVSRGSSGGPLFNSEGRVIGVISFIMVAGQNVNFGISVNALKDLIGRTQETSSDVSGLEKEPDRLLGEIGILPPRRRTIEVRVPKEPPYTVALLPYHQYDPETITARIDERALRRVTKEDDLKPGRFMVTSLGVLKFHESEKEKKVTVECEYRPYRVAIFIEVDSTGGDLRKILEERFAKLGDEVVVGAEVDAAVQQWRRQGSDGVRDLGKVLDCSRLVTARLDSLESWTGRWCYIVTNVQLHVLDLNTGREILRQSAFRSGEVHQMHGWRSFRKRLAEKSVDSILGPLP